MIKKMLEKKTTSHSSPCATLANNHLVAQFIAKGLQPFSVLNNTWIFQFFIPPHQIPVTNTHCLCGCSLCQKHHRAALSPTPHARVMSTDFSLIQETAPPHNARSASDYRMQSTILLFCQSLRDVTDTINSATILSILITYHIFCSHLMPLAEETFIFLTMYSVQSKWGATGVSTVSHPLLKGLLFQMSLSW